MKVPINILSIIEKINKSEDDWKAIYMANWRFSYWLRENFENTQKWDEKQEFGLPAFKKGHHDYTPSQLYIIVTSKDIKTTYEHLIILLSMFEALLEETSKFLCSPKFKINHNGSNISGFFEDENTKDILEEGELNELFLAKETRNCYLHHGGKINDKWIKYYKDTKGTSLVSEGDDLNKGFQEGKPYLQIEEWHNLIVDITNRIKSKIEEK